MLAVELLRRIRAERDGRGRALEIIESTVVRWVRHLTQPKTREEERYLRLVRPMAPSSSGQCQRIARAEATSCRGCAIAREPQT